MGKIKPANATSTATPLIIANRLFIGAPDCKMAPHIGKTLAPIVKFSMNFTLSALARHSSGT